MAKITLGARPKTIKRTLDVPMPDGSTGKLGVSYVYRTRTEFGKFVDDFFKPAPQPPADAQAEDALPEVFSAHAMQVERVESNARYLVATIDSWDLDVPFTPAAAHQLCDEDPAIATALMAGYRDAVTEGRLGN